MLLLAVGGTSALGLRYAENRGSDEFLSVVVGIAVIVGLWALLIASTPQVVSLRGSVLTVRNSSGSERFDLADGLQPVDVVGQPRSSGWALLLHRANNTSVVLRRRDVDAVALDPIVRHYRAIAEQRYTDRQVRFRPADERSRPPIRAGRDSSARTATTPARMNRPPTSWTGRGSSPSSIQANSTVNRTSESPTNEASLAPSTRVAVIPVT